MRLLLKLLGLVVALVILYELWIFAQVWWWSTHNPRSTAFMEQNLSALREKDPRAVLQHEWVPYNRISPHLKRAVIASEDAKFADHEGFDWDAIEKAYEKNLQKGRIVAGGSTISQQLAKNLFLSGERSPLRKGQEAIITLMLERVMSKRRILEIYLNVIEWGNGVFGAEAAARHYFGTSAANVGAGDAAWLAAIVPNPKFYDARRNTPWIQRKTQIIRARMGAAEVP
ncbi:MAG: monofunctional biosynthetic peptidoglycan transglycosylase [Betaproteobacteria bacterium]|nr:monofunctional biosynthetic peptidoglycan transglycosylase [Betaproteobacteria bacterium]